MPVGKAALAAILQDSAYVLRIHRTRKMAQNPGFFKRYIVNTVNRFLDDDATTMGAAIAYYTTFSIAPLLLMVISIAGLVFRHDVVQRDIQQQIEGLIGTGP